MRAPLTLPHRLRALARHVGDRPAAFDAEGSLTYAELAREIDAVAAGLRRTGIGPGERIATAMEPSVAYLLVVLGSLAAGVVPAVVNTRLTESELRAYLRRIEPAAIVCDPSHRALADKLDAPVIELADALTPAPAATRVAPLHGGPPLTDEPAEDAPALIFPTGGTTGTPKGAYYDQRGVWMWCNSVAQSEPDRKPGVELFCSPFFHVTLGVCLLARLFVGDTVRILHSFSPGEVLAAIGDGAHRIIGATTMFTALREHPDFAATPRDHLRRIQFGASPATPQYIRQLLADFPQATIRSAYGATEFGPVTGMEHEDLVTGRVEGVGRVLPGAELWIADDEGRPLPVGEVGEIRVRSPWATVGYWGMPEETAATFLPDGIRSGDLGRFEPDGWLHLAGRSKELIISGGENIFPTEVERVLCEHPAVRELIIYGVADDYWGERVEAGVVLRDGATLTLEELREFGRARLAGYKLPLSLRTLDAIPLTPNHKPDRRAARRLAEAAGD